MAEEETWTYEPPKAKRFMRLMWKASGGDAAILVRCPYGEQVKFACLGGIVASTGILAGVAAIYALQTIFVPTDPNTGWLKYDATMLGSVILGTLWGCIIFNLDRYIVASTGKGDGTERITKQELVNALPRMILGFIIAVTIAKPLEIRIFKPEIDAHLYRVQQEEIVKNKDAIAARYDDDVTRVEAEIDRLSAEITAQRGRADAAEEVARLELDGGAGGRGRGAGAVYREKKELADRERAIFVTVQRANSEAIEELRTEIEAIDARRLEEESVGEAAAAGLSGFLARMEAAHDLAGPGVIWSITLLFVAIELTPIFFKLMLIKGPYDYLEENAKRVIMARHGIDVRHRFEPGLEPTDLEEVGFHHEQRHVHLHRVTTQVQTAAYDRWGEHETTRLSSVVSNGGEIGGLPTGQTSEA